MIKFSLINIKDISKLFEITQLSETSTKEEDIRNEYCKHILELLKTSQVISDYSYEGTLDRISNEVFKIYSNDTNFKTSFTFDTYNKFNKITVKIEDYENKVPEDVLENFKLNMKELLLKDWESCTWLIDYQSEFFASNLYRQIHSVENSIRELIYDVMLKLFGKDWINIPELSKVYSEYKSRNTDFKRKVTHFKNVDDNLISLSTETLFKIMKTKIYFYPIDLNNEKIKRKIFIEDNSDKLSDFLKKQYQVKYDLWASYFKPLFPENIDTLINDFIKNRNHVAHNKLIDSEANRKIKENISQMEKFFQVALEKSFEIEMSEEYIETLEIIEEDKIAQIKHIRNTKELEAGITIKNKSEIIEIFQEIINEIYFEIRDSYYFDYDFEFSDLNVEITENEEICLFEILIDKAALSIKLIITATIYIDDSESGISSLILKLQQNDLCLHKSIIDCNNGEAIFNEEQSNYLPQRDFELDDSQKTDFIEAIFSFIQENK
ncbi:MAG: hypothetical protein PWP46_1643 [Fusobacteriaceae bacterium]|jgi:hypothetical protein|nr:hypothetical protein [Fusobacteriales bacterium]MDN5304757.1 hypothetical protein [Fusobacteriaceae bacterium]